MIVFIQDTLSKVSVTCKQIKDTQKYLPKPPQNLGNSLDRFVEEMENKQLSTSYKYNCT